MVIVFDGVDDDKVMKMTDGITYKGYSVLNLVYIIHLQFYKFALIRRNKAIVNLSGTAFTAT